MKTKKTRSAKTAKAVVRSSRSRRGAVSRKQPALAAESQGAESPAATPPNAVPLKTPAEAPPRIPPLLLEGDRPVETPAPEPAPKFTVGPTPPPAPVAPSAPRELPASYGTGKLWLTARDPHHLYAHWDFTREQQEQYQALSADQRLVLRVYSGGQAGQPVSEVPVAPDSRHSFVLVGQAGAQYSAEMGYYRSDRSWTAVSAAPSVATPPDRPAPDKTVQFASVPGATVALPVTEGAPVAPIPAPLDLAPPIPPPPAALPPGVESAPQPASGLLVTAEQSVPPVAPVAAPAQLALSTVGPLPRPEAVAALPPAVAAMQPAPALLQARPRPEVSVPVKASDQAEKVSRRPILPVNAEWTEALEQVFAEMTELARKSRNGISSMELVELLRLQLQRRVAGEVSPELAAPAAAVEGQAGMPEVGPLGISSPVGGEVRPPGGFWFNINAELIIYGATEPSARVTLGGRDVKLRPDGTFTCRFALPDGWHELAATATSITGEQREAQLKFSRSTRYEAGTGMHPADPNLEAP